MVEGSVGLSYGMAVEIIVPLADPPGAVQTVRAFLTPTPGLVAHRGLRPPECWVVTHQRSGHVVGVADDPETAMALATRLAPVTDWTRSAAEIFAAGIRASDVRNAIGDFAASGLRPQKPVDRNVVAS